MTMITPSYLGETIEYSSLHACRSTLEDPTAFLVMQLSGFLPVMLMWIGLTLADRNAKKVQEPVMPRMMGPNRYVGALARPA